MKRWHHIGRLSAKFYASRSETDVKQWLVVMSRAVMLLIEDLAGLVRIRLDTLGERKKRVCKQCNGATCTDEKQDRNAGTRSFLVMRSRLRFNDSDFFD
jgi:hypothetical protein